MPGQAESGQVVSTASRPGSSTADSSGVRLRPAAAHAARTHCAGSTEVSTTSPCSKKMRSPLLSGLKTSHPHSRSSVTGWP